MKIDKILENYPELDSSRKAELKEELLGLFSVRLSLPTLKEIDEWAIAFAKMAHPKDTMKTFREYTRTDYTNGAIAVRNMWAKSNET